MSKGPGKDTRLNPSSLTVGVTKSGECFEIVDDWKKADNRHRDIGEHWIGYIVFTQEDYSGDNFMKKRTVLSKLKPGVRWADEDEYWLVPRENA